MFNDIQRIDDRGRIHAVGQRDLGREDRGGLEGMSRPVSGFSPPLLLVEEPRGDQ